MKLTDDDKRVLDERNFPEKIKKMIEDMPKDDIMRIHDFAEYVLIKERVSKADMKSNEKLTDKEISKIAEEGSFDGKMAERIDYAEKTDYLIANYKWKRDNGLNDKKYGLTNETIEIDGHTLHRIRALKDFGNVKMGDFGGFIEKEENLSHEGNCWVYGNACVFEDAEVREDARVFDEVKVYSKAEVYGEAKICGRADVFGNAEVTDKAKVYGEAWVYGNACVFGNAEVCGYAKVYGKADVHGDAKVCENAKVCGRAEVCGDMVVSGIINGKECNGKVNKTKKKENIEQE